MIKLSTLNLINFFLALSILVVCFFVTKDITYRLIIGCEILGCMVIVSNIDYHITKKNEDN